MSLVGTRAWHSSQSRPAVPSPPALRCTLEPGPASLSASGPRPSTSLPSRPACACPTTSRKASKPWPSAASPISPVADCASPSVESAFVPPTPVTTLKIAGLRLDRSPRGRPADEFGQHVRCICRERLTRPLRWRASRPPDRRDAEAVRSPPCVHCGCCRATKAPHAQREGVEKVQQRTAFQYIDALGDQGAGRSGSLTSIWRR